MATDEPSQNRVYLYRLLTLEVDYGYKVVRKIYDEAISNVALDKILKEEQNKTVLKNLNKGQKEVLFPKYGKTPTSDDFDFTLLVHLLSNLHLLDRNPNSSWYGQYQTSSWTDQLDQGDTSVVADIRRLKSCRNDLAHMCSTNEIDEIKFNKTWKYIKLVLIRLNGKLKTPVQNLQDEIDNCKDMSLDPKTLIRIEKHIDEYLPLLGKLDELELRTDRDDKRIVALEEEQLKQSICNDIKSRSDQILKVWPAYRENKENEIVYVVITKSDPTSLELMNQLDDFEIIIRQDGETNEENRKVLQNEVETYTYIDDSNEEAIRNEIESSSETLRSQHSNITMISASSMKSKDYAKGEHTMERNDCIVLSVHIKGLIPVGELPFPKSIGRFKVDVREDVFKMFCKSNPSNKFHQDLKMGCEISRHGETGYGTLGGFIQHEEHGLCLLTCAHVLLDSNELRSNTPQIVCNQPKSDREDSKRCGELIRHRVGKVEDKMFVDVALVKLDEGRQPIDGIFPEISEKDLKDSGFGESWRLEFKSGKVYNIEEMLKHKKKPFVKYGATTQLRKGRYQSYGADVTYQLFEENDLIMKNQIKILDEKNSPPFAEPGDSGSLVFVDTNDGLIATGMLSGGGEGYAIITPMCNILLALGYAEPYSLKSFEEMDESKDS